MARKTEIDVPVVAIVGMHRSGTSLIAQMLHELGLYQGEPDELSLVSGEHNPAGFWENVHFKRVNKSILAAMGTRDEMSDFERPDNWWRNLDKGIEDAALDAISANDKRCTEGLHYQPWGFKDPRTCLTLDFWQYMISGLRTIFVWRHPAEIVGSLERRGMRGRDLLYQMVATHQDRALQAVDPDLLLVVRYNQLFNKNKSFVYEEIWRMMEFCDLDSWDKVDQAVDIIDQKHRHFKS